LEKSALVILKGISICISDEGPLRNEMMASPDFWVILRHLSSNAKAASAVFDILDGVTAGSSPAVTADNYEAAVALLNDFASAGGVGATLEQKQDKRSRRPQQNKPSKPR
jgi:brefeldin A-resistance guanine nucleotide exchange factor 1